MRIFVISSKKVLNFLVILVSILAVVICATLFSPQMIQVFSGVAHTVPIYSVETSEKKAAITFDCAWGASDIDSILDTLKKEKVNATFFLVGEWMQKFPDKVKLIAAEGNDIANHSDTHSYLTQLSTEKIQKEIIDANTKIEQLTGQKCNLFRVPYGDYNQNVVKVANKEGQYTIQWDVDSLDWKDIPVESICDRVLTKVKNGSIILMHNDTKYTAQALPDLIKKLKEKGYTLVPVSKLIYKDNYTIDFEGRQHLMK
jgi:polysaccharide deacetylase family sporulation protein PdaB